MACQTCEERRQAIRVAVAKRDVVATAKATTVAAATLVKKTAEAVAKRGRFKR